MIGATGLVAGFGGAVLAGLDAGDTSSLAGFVVENLLNLFLPVEVARFLPFFAGNELLAYNNDFDTPEAIAVALTRPESALVFGGYAGIALLVGTVLLYRRDTN